MGSAYGDAQLVKLRTTLCTETGSFLEILESYTNLGPILDFCVVDLDKRGQSQVCLLQTAMSLLFGRGLACLFDLWDVIPGRLSRGCVFG